jgi:hypothetical protein
MDRYLATFVDDASFRYLGDKTIRTRYLFSKLVMVAMSDAHGRMLTGLIIT